jgi:hypothetical protein
MTKMITMVVVLMMKCQLFIKFEAIKGHLQLSAPLLHVRGDSYSCVSEHHVPDVEQVHQVHHLTYLRSGNHEN